MKFSVEEFIEQLSQRKEVLIDLSDASLGKKLQVKSLVDGFTQKELSGVLGISVSTLSDYENDRRKVSLRHIDAVHEYLYCSLYEDKEYIGPVDQSEWGDQDE
jgi:transcriptional regulator with XRE-family HTH domain